QAGARRRRHPLHRLGRRAAVAGEPGGAVAGRGGDDAVRRDAAHPPVLLVGDVGGAGGGARQRVGLLEARMLGRAAGAGKAAADLTLCIASVAGPPSPANPAVPLPATVEMTPSGAMRRTRWFCWSVM